MLGDEKKLFADLKETREQVTALAALCERYKMALEAANACDYGSDREKVIRLALK